MLRRLTTAIPGDAMFDLWFPALGLATRKTRVGSSGGCRPDESRLGGQLLLICWPTIRKDERLVDDQVSLSLQAVPAAVRSHVSGTQGHGAGSN